jgi:Uma2 family endonuclease
LQYVFNKRAKYYKQEVQNFEHAPDIINNVYFLSPEKQSEYKMSDYQEFYRNLLIYSITGKNKHDDASGSLCGLLI